METMRASHVVVNRRNWRGNSDSPGSNWPPARDVGFIPHADRLRRRSAITAMATRAMSSPGCCDRKLITSSEGSLMGGYRSGQPKQCRRVTVVGIELANLIPDLAAQAYASLRRKRNVRASLRAESRSAVTVARLFDLR